MRSLKIIFGTHNGQPVGNFNSINEQVYQNAYKPFLRTLYNYPDFPITLHYSGTLLEWLEEFHPEFMMLLDEMVKRKQVELLGGGYYEPILSIIPNSDKLGQIEALTTYIRSRFGKRPRGSWITERVWEPYLASILRNSGMEYTFLDDIHFKAAGVKKEKLFYPYLTEDQGKVVAVYAISGNLRDLIPHREPEEVIKFLADLADDSGERIITLLDNGEKFGDWEDSYRRLYKENWLNRFMELLSGNSDWLEPIHPARYLKKYNCHDKIYIGCVLYEEMFDWLQPAGIDPGTPNPGQRESIKLGSSFRQFFCKYPESNFIYSKMIYVSILVNQIRGDRYKKKAAKEELWRGQCHAAYWHGDFDGLYASHLRQSVYQALLEAEKLTRIDGVFLPSVISLDFDTDGRVEYLYQGDKYNGYVHTRGGMLFEIDYLPVSRNYLDTMNRYREPYHDAAAGRNHYDWYPRKAFLDHFFDEQTNPENFQAMTYPETGDFLNAYYPLESINKEKFIIVFSRNGKITKAGKEYPVSLRKQYQFNEAGIIVSYCLINLSADDLLTSFAIENNFALPGGGLEQSNFLRMKDEYTDLAKNTFREQDLKNLSLRDLQNTVQLDLTVSRAGQLWSFPVETLSRTLKARNKIYQASCFLFSWQLALSPGDEWRLDFTLSFSRTSKF